MTDYDPNELVARAVRTARPVGRQQGKHRWAVVAEIFSCGRTRARELCERFGTDPDEPLSGEIDERSDSKETA